MSESSHFENRRSLDLICMGRVAVDLYAEQVHSPLEDAQSWWTRKKSEASTAGKNRMLRTPCIERNEGVEWFDDP